MKKKKRGLFLYLPANRCMSACVLCTLNCCPALAAGTRAQLYFVVMVSALSFLMGIHAVLPLVKHQQLITNTNKTVWVWTKTHTHTLVSPLSQKQKQKIDLNIFLSKYCVTAKCYLTMRVVFKNHKRVIQSKMIDPLPLYICTFLKVIIWNFGKRTLSLLCWCETYVRRSRPLFLICKYKATASRKQGGW